MWERVRPIRDSGIKKQARGKASVSNSGQMAANMMVSGLKTKLTVLEYIVG
jgi:hypothetical protein